MKQTEAVVTGWAGYEPHLPSGETRQVPEDPQQREQQQGANAGTVTGVGDRVRRNGCKYAERGEDPCLLSELIHELAPLVRPSRRDRPPPGAAPPPPAGPPAPGGVPPSRGRRHDPRDILSRVARHIEPFIHRSAWTGCSP